MSKLRRQGKITLSIYICNSSKFSKNAIALYYLKYFVFHGFMSKFIKIFLFIFGVAILHGSVWASGSENGGRPAFKASAVPQVDEGEIARIKENLPQVANPIHDVAFKNMLNSKKDGFVVAKALIKAFVPELGAINSIDDANWEVSITRADDHTGTSNRRRYVGSVDFRVTTDQAEFIIEMQSMSHDNFDLRELYYLAQAYGNQVIPRNKQDSEWFENLRPAYSICFGNWDKSSMYENSERKVSEYVRHYVMHDTSSGLSLRDGIHLLEIELKKADK